MFKTELINVNTSEKRSVSFLEDDTIETVRKQIAKTADIHHDRLFVLVGIQCNRNYYTSDPRRWEALFERISLNGRPIEKELFDEYLATYRTPTISVPYTKFDKSEWMTYPDELRDIFEPPGNFVEYRILGVELNKSYCLPLKFNMFLSARIPSINLPIPENTEMFLTLHDRQHVVRFLVKEHETDIAGAYFPLLRSTTPLKLSDDEIQRMDRTTKNILDLLALDAPPPKEVHILKLSWFAELVDTDLGESIRNRFEQIFYGLTVSKTVPCITLYTGRADVSRHKFYTENPKTKKPFLDTAMWGSWWTKSKPPRNRPTLVLYRGTSRESYDRISITSSDISLAAYRCSKNTETIEESRDSILKWFGKFDAIVPFIKTSDIQTERIKLQDVRYEAVYSDILEELDTRRMNCVADMFAELKTHKTAFRFLRTDFASENINSTDIRIIELLNETPFLKPYELEKELNISREEATRLLTNMQTRIKDEPWLLNKKPRGFPLFEFKSSGVVANAVSDLDRSIKYLNILQYILSDPVSKQLDKICPKRVEKLGSIVSTVNTSTVFDDEFADLFDYIVEEEEKEPEKASLNTTKNSSTYGYFHERLQKIDPDTFSPEAFADFPRKCEQGHQPVIMTDQDLQTVPEKFNPRIHEAEDKKIEVTEPDGVMICPEYWCMYDKIPLTKAQLVKVDGKDACPVCNGKVQTLKDKNKDSREYSVIQKTKGHNYPGYMKHISAINKKNLPCCYKTPANSKKLESNAKDQKYYILGETKTPLEPLRFAYVPQQILDALSIPETYSLVRAAHDRIQSGLSGFFRIGLGRASQTFPEIFQRDAVRSPLYEIENTLSCSFVSSWLTPDDTHSERIAEELKKYLLFKDDDLARERISKILSGINTAFENATLTPAQEIEYSAIVLKIDIYRIVIDDMTVRCTFDTAKFAKTAGVILLEYNNEIDCLCHIVRNQRTFEYRANIFKSPFPPDLKEYIADDAVYKTCTTEQPDLGDAYEVLVEFFGDTPDDTFILDPYGNSVALYKVDTFILPFKTTPTPQFKNVKFIAGFANIRNNLPTYEYMTSFIKKIVAAAKYPGWKLYEIARELHDSDGNIVELETISGLRIPIKPVPAEGVNEEVIQTVNNETELVFGSPNVEDTEKYQKISYNAEIYNFLIFQLSTDLQGDDHSELRDAIQNLPKTRKKLEKSLEHWFNKTTFFNAVSEPIQFLSKIRTPCGQMQKCDSGNMCGWDKNQCKVQIRDTVSKPNLFNKILATLIDNEKSRFMILDGKTTPFFSTILYIELPTEVILTDSQIKQT
jgi:hypothetical protein